MLVDRGLYLFIRYSHELVEWCLGVGRYVTVYGGNRAWMKSLFSAFMTGCSGKVLGH